MHETHTAEQHSGHASSHAGEGHGTHEEGSLNRLAASASTRCLTGCVIGEVLGIVIGTAIGLGDVETMVLAITLAFCFGYGLTAIPLSARSSTSG